MDDRPTGRHRRLSITNSPRRNENHGLSGLKAHSIPANEAPSTESTTADNAAASARPENSGPDAGAEEVPAVVPVFVPLLSQEDQVNLVANSAKVRRALLREDPDVRDLKIGVVIISRVWNEVSADARAGGIEDVRRPGKIPANGDVLRSRLRIRFRRVTEHQARKDSRELKSEE